MNQGLIYAFTGEGKGKTSAALGVATRALLIDKQVIWVAFYKGKNWDLAEKKLVEKFPNLQMYFTGKGFKISESKSKRVSESVKTAKVAGGAGIVVDTASEEQHKAAAEAGLSLVSEKLQGTEPCFLLVMDEILNAVSDGLLSSEEVVKVLSKRGETHIILTGRAGIETAGRLLEVSDLVTECKKIKHPYDLGKLAVRGLDF